MNALNIKLTGNVFGRTDEPASGKKLFALTFVDLEDAEDTRTQLWIANDEDDLYELFKEQENDLNDPDEELEKEDALIFGAVWGYEILPFEIGTVM